MNIINFINTLRTIISKNDIIDDLTIRRRELKDVTIPLYRDAVNNLADYKYKSQKVINLNKTFNSIVKSSQNNNFLVSIHRGLRNLDDLSTKLINLVDKTFEKNTTVDGITFSKVQIIQLIEAVYFINRYAPKLLNFIIIMETSTYDENQSNYIKESLTNAQIDYINNNFKMFCMLIEKILAGPDNTIKLLSKIPEYVAANETEDTLVALKGRSAIDPIGFSNFIAPWLNPIYHIGIKIAEYQTNRYEELKDETKLIKLRILNLENILGDEPNPVIEKEINYYQDLVQKNELKLEDMEKKYGKTL